MVIEDFTLEDLDLADQLLAAALDKKINKLQHLSGTAELNGMGDIVEYCHNRAVILTASWSELRYMVKRELLQPGS